MITGYTIKKNGARGYFDIKSWDTLKNILEKEQDLKKIELFKTIIKYLKKLDCEIRTIEPKTKDFNKIIVEVGLFERLGEQGGDILTLTYEEFPTQEEIKQDVEKNLKETYEDLKDSLLSAREETQLKVLKRILKKWYLKK